MPASLIHRIQRAGLIRIAQAHAAIGKTRFQLEQAGANRLDTRARLLAQPDGGRGRPVHVQAHR